MTTEPKKPDPRTVGLPIRPILWTLDQIATMVGSKLETLKQHYVHYDGRSVGVRKHKRLLARNIAEAGEKPDWRVAEAELLRWMKACGFRIYERGWPKF